MSIIAFETVYICILQSKGRVVTAVITAISLDLVKENQSTATVDWKVEEMVVLISYQAQPALMVEELRFITEPLV